jgi:DNA-binding SARP family transcriptional activator
VLDPGDADTHGPGEPLYRIHPLVRDALAARLPAAERRPLATRIGDYYAGVDQPHAAAALYIEAADDESLARLIERCGKQLLAEGHAGSLAGWLARLPPDALDRRPALLTCGADVKAELGDFAAAVALYEQAIVRLERVDDRHLMIDALRRLAGLHERRGHYERAAVALDQAAALLPEGEPLLAISLQNQLATVRLYGGQPEEALSLLADVVERCRTLGHKDREAVALHNLGEAWQLLGRIQPAVDAYRASLALKREARHWSGIALTLNSLGVLHHQSGRLDRAEAALEEARQVASGHDARFVLSYILSNLADLHRDRSDAGRALPLYEQSLAIKEEMGNPFAIAHTWACLAALWRQAGDLPRAREYIQRALDLRGPEAGVVERLRYREEQALIELSAGHAEAAAGELASVAEEFARLGAAYLHLHAGWHAARALWAADGSLDPALPGLLEEAGRAGFEAFVGRAAREAPAFTVAAWLDSPSAFLARQLAAIESALPQLVAALDGDDPDRTDRVAALLAELPGNEPLQALAAAAGRSLSARAALDRLATLPAPRLSVSGFGGLEVQRRGRPIPARAWTRRRALDVLALLLLAGPAGRSRDDLILNCWPDATPEAGVNQFHTHLRVLRSVLEPESAHTGVARYVSGEGGVYRLDFELIERWDVERFEEALGRAREHDRSGDAPATVAALAQAVELYQGPLFDGLAPQGDWLDPARERFQRRALEAALRLGELRLTAGDEDGAIDAWSRVLDLDEAREDAHRALMRLYLTQGRRDDALGQYRRCVLALRRDLDVDPHPDTVALYRAILRG